MNVTDNYKKHKSWNPLQRYLLNKFYEDLISMIKGLDDSGQAPIKSGQARMTREIASSPALPDPRNDERGKGQHSIKSVLDAGCGEGFTLIRLSANKIGKKLEGVDFSKESILIGKKIHPHITLNIGDIYKLPYENDSFDLVISTEVLEHLSKPEEALEEILRVSKKYCLLSVPNEPFFTVVNFLRGKNLTRFGNDVEHINHWSTIGFEKFLKQKNVRILLKKHPFPWTVILIEKM